MQQQDSNQNVATDIVNANDVQVAGNHYKSAYQHWDLVPDVGMGYFDGQITKYVSRWQKKNGLQDLEKSRHFAIKYKELLQNRILFAPMRADPLKTANCLIRYLDTNAITGQESFVVTQLTKTHGLDDVLLVIDVLTEMVIDEKARILGVDKNAV